MSRSCFLFCSFQCCIIECFMNVFHKIMWGIFNIFNNSVLNLDSFICNLSNALFWWDLWRWFWHLKVMWRDSKWLKLSNVTLIVWLQSFQPLSMSVYIIHAAQHFCLDWGFLLMPSWLTEIIARSQVELNYFATAFKQHA